MVTKSDIGRNRIAVAKQATEARRAAQAKQASPELDRVKAQARAQMSQQRLLPEQKEALEQERQKINLMRKVVNANRKEQMSLSPLSQQRKYLQGREANLKAIQRKIQGQQLLPEQKEALKQERQEINSIRAAKARGNIAPGLIPTPGALKPIKAAKGTLVKKPTVKKVAVKKPMVKKITAKKK